MGQALNLVGDALSFGATSKQARGEKRVEQAQMNETALNNQRQRLNAVREARVRQAQALQSAASGGTSNSSTVSGAAGSIESQAQAQEGFIQNVGAFQYEKYLGQREIAKGQQIKDYTADAEKLNSDIESIGKKAATGGADGGEGA